MFKKTMTLILAVCMLVAGIAFAAPSQAAVNYSLEVNGTQVSSSAYPVTVYNGTVMVPAKIVVKLLDSGATYSYSKGRITVKYNGNTYTMRTSSTKYYKNGKYSKALARPILKNSIVYLPLSFFSNVMGITAQIDAYGKITITGTPSSPSDPNATVPITINGNTISAKGYFKDGFYMMFPLQAISNYAGSNYSYTESSRRAQVIRNGVVYSAQTTDKNLAVNGIYSKTMSVAPEIKNGVFYVPTAFIETAFGATVTNTGASFAITKLGIGSIKYGSIPYYINNTAATFGAARNAAGTAYLVPLDETAAALGYSVSVNSGSGLITLTKSGGVMGYTKIEFTPGVNSFKPYSGSTALADMAMECAAEKLTFGVYSMNYIPVGMVRTMMAGSIEGPRSDGSFYLTAPGYSGGTPGGTGVIGVFSSSSPLFINSILASKGIIQDPVSQEYMIELNTAANALGYSVNVSGTQVTMTRGGSNTTGATSISFTVGNKVFNVVYSGTSYATAQPCAPGYATVSGVTSLYIPADTTELLMGGSIAGPASGAFYLNTTGGTSGMTPCNLFIRGTSYPNAAYKVGSETMVPLVYLATKAGYGDKVIMLSNNTRCTIIRTSAPLNLPSQILMTINGTSYDIVHDYPSAYTQTVTMGKTMMIGGMVYVPTTLCYYIGLVPSVSGNTVTIN